MLGATAVALAVIFGVPGFVRGAAAADVYRLTAAMSPRQVVTPADKPWPVPAAYSSARGTFTGTFNAATGRLAWKLTFSALTRPKLRIVDIHYGAPGRFGAFLTRACAGCTSGQRGVIRIKRLARKDLTTGKAWVTLITEDYPNGVIRGQIKARKVT
jgi:hypothetical protein